MTPNSQYQENFDGIQNGWLIYQLKDHLILIKVYLKTIF